MLAAESVAKMASSDFEDDDLCMMWRDSRRGVCAGEGKDEA
jgi:hypothetical protein